MADKKKILYFVALGLLSVSEIVVLSVSLRLWLKVLLAVIIVAGIAFLTVLYLKSLKKTKVEKTELSPIEQKLLTIENPTLLDMYAVLQIPPQYNEDGTLKNMFELLGITPKYNKDGLRIATIYEQLKVNPLFNDEGSEIPFVACIKNRINSVIKLETAPPPLYYVTREQKASGTRPIFTQEEIDQVSKELPKLKEIAVVKPPIKKPAAKSKPAAKVDYGKSTMKVSITGTFKIKYNAVKDFSSAGSGKLFDINASRQKGSDIKEKSKDPIKAPSFEVVGREEKPKTGENEKKIPQKGKGEFVPVGRKDGYEYSVDASSVNDGYQPQQ